MQIMKPKTRDTPQASRRRERESHRPPQQPPHPSQPVALFVCLCLLSLSLSVCSLASQLVYRLPWRQSRDLVDVFEVLADVSLSLADSYIAACIADCWDSWDLLLRRRCRWVRNTPSLLTQATRGEHVTLAALYVWIPVCTWMLVSRK